MVQTDNAQLGIFVVSAALYDLVNAQSPMTPGFFAGHSLGELTAYYAAGVVDFETGLKIVDKRGTLMRESAEKQPGAMAAILGLPSDAIESVVADIEGVIIANYNAPVQSVISDTKEAVQSACEAPAAGAKRVVPAKLVVRFTPIRWPLLQMDFLSF